MKYNVVHRCIFAGVVISMLSSVRCQTQDLRAFCTNYLTSSLRACDSEECQGRDGKRGPVGMKGDTGAKGEKGDRGPGTDNLQQRLDALEEKLANSEKMAAFNFCALGMKSGIIPDLSITTSQNRDGLSLEKFARLDNQAAENFSSGAWCSSATDRGKWIKIDLGKLQPISGLITQGSPSSDNWVTSFTVSCGDSRGAFKDIVEHGTVKVFRGNADRSGPVVNMFAEVVNCRYIRVNVQEWRGLPCLRMEFLRGSCHSPHKFTFYVESAGMDDGNTCKIMINGVNQATGGRGHCVVTLNVKTQSITAQTFDTYGTVQKVTEMLNFLNSAPDYSVIAIAVVDATNPHNWNADISSLLEDLGAVGNTGNSTLADVRDSWAFITQKVGRNDPRPSWVKHQHVLRYNGKATVHAAISLSAFYPSWDDTPIH